MRLRYWSMIAALLSAVVPSPAAPQSASDSDIRAREYIQFLVQQLDQWTRDLPQAYNLAMMRPPVDVAALSEGEKAGAETLRETVRHLTSLSQVGDVSSNAAFRTQLEKTVQAAAPVNAALGSQRFPEAIETDWAQIRTTLNSLAAIYKLSELAVLEAPGPGSGRNKQPAAIPAGAVIGYVVDQRCAAIGKSMWSNAACVQKCVRDGDKVVFVTEQGKVLQFVSPEKIDADSYGQKVAVTGKTEGDTITVASLQIL